MGQYLENGVLKVREADKDVGITELRVKLMHVLEGSEQRYDASVLLELLPTNYLIKERAIILIKLKQYNQAIDLTVD
jgi:hypothetical protein